MVAASTTNVCLSQELLVWWQSEIVRGTRCGVGKIFPFAGLFDHPAEYTIRQCSTVNRVRNYRLAVRSWVEAIDDLLNSESGS